MAKSKIYALLIGINEYDYFETEVGQYNLDGCISDSQAIADYLKENIADADERLFIRNLQSPVPNNNIPEEILVNCAAEEFFRATRQQIIVGFQDFLTQATPEDTVLIYFSGHGLTYDQPKELWHLAQENNGNHKGQALMCADTYMEGEEDWIPTLKDWEIRWLMHQIAGDAETQPHIIMFSDCCYSGGNTRDFDQQSAVKIRGLSDLELKGNIKSKDIAEFIFYQNSKKTKKLLKKHPASFELPHVRHVALSAAHNYELAKEMEFDEGTFGIFTYYLLKTLRATKGQISYRDLVKIIRAKTTDQINFQTPQYYATQPTDADLLFLGGAIVQEAPYFMVRPMEATDKETSKEAYGIMDGGALHGIPLEKEGQTIISLASPINSSITQKVSLEGELIQVGVHESIVQLKNSIFPKDVSYLKARIINTPIPKTKIFITIEGKRSKKKTKGVALLKEALAKTIFLEVVESATAAQYKLIVYLTEGQGKYRMTKIDQSNVLVAPKIGFNPTTAAIFVKEMEHIARWEHSFQLHNPHPTTIQEGDIELIAIDENGTKFKEGLVNLTATADRIPELRLKVKMKNKKQVPLYCALIHLTNNYGIETSYLAPETQLGKKKYKDEEKKIKWKQWEVFALSHITFDGQTHPTGLSLGFTVSEEQLEQGIRTTDDHFKLIVSTEQFDARHLYQGNLASPKGKLEFSTLPVQNVLEDITSESQNRKKKKAKKASKNADWWTSMLTVRTTRK